MGLWHQPLKTVLFGGQFVSLSCITAKVTAQSEFVEPAPKLHIRGTLLLQKRFIKLWPVTSRRSFVFFPTINTKKRDRIIDFDSMSTGSGLRNL
jgi:hypothetical protein